MGGGNRMRDRALNPKLGPKQKRAVEVYAEQAADVGGNPDADRAAKIVAVERAGFTRAQTEAAKLRQFERLWKSDEARQYLAELWGIAVPDEPDPVSVAFQMLHTHMVQNDETWGARDRATSISASREVIKLFVPAAPTKVLTGHLSARIERPAEFDHEPVMAARTILPAGQKLTAPTGPTGGDTESEDDRDDDDS
jgi:hypothetical protein